ncbi:DegV family protein [Alkaliphilus sp. B6464]|uniref:DegV family protein n=1 Tax=Alkaliphilus sp. B6464 TaxID=2731219 RepID=UPI001BACE359|nr:DegV family protein [Alkaliphilus sp. B6464]QUH21361.1 DegV family protein [Alkaliphilus sp. B6464]
MSKIQIITDSMIDVPKDIVEKHNIIVMPLTIIFGDKEYRDGVDLTNAQFYEKLSQSEELPKTSQISPNTFMQIFEKVLGEGKEVLCINGSSRASGTHQSAIIAKNSLESDKIQVFDTMGLSFGGGMFVYEAAEMAKDGKSLKEIMDRLNEIKLKVDHIFTVDTLEYLKKGGRLNPMKATIATMLNIKPILTVAEGLVEPLDKVRGSKKVVGKMIELAKQRGNNFENKVVGISHAICPEAIAVLKEQVLNELNPKEVIVTEIGCTIGTHAGPGTLAIFYIVE